MASYPGGMKDTPHHLPTRSGHHWSSIRFNILTSDAIYVIGTFLNHNCQFIIIIS